MFVNKINNVSNNYNIRFKGYQHVKNDVGESVMKFNFPYDDTKETCEIYFYRTIPTENYNHKVVDNPVAHVFLKPEGVEVDLNELTDLNPDEPFAYKIVKKDKNDGHVTWEGADTGVKIRPQGQEYVYRVNNDMGPYGFNDSVNNFPYTLVSRKGTTPMVQGAGYLITPGSFAPGYKRFGFDSEKTGQIYYDTNHQKKMEGVTKNFANVYGGNLAGMEAKIPYLKDAGYKVVFSTPIANGSNAWALGYWNKNNMQISPNMGNLEDFSSYMTKLFANGMKFVNDGTFTSEGLEGIHLQYALRWADKNPQSKYWFRMRGINDSNLGLGVVPKNSKNMRFKAINNANDYVLQSDGTYKKVPNKDYDPNKETYFQIYDSSLTSKELANDKTKPIEAYDKIDNVDDLEINTHNDTLANYKFEINPKDLDKRIDIINGLIKSGRKITLDSPEGVMLAGQFPTFKIDEKTEGGFVTWDANTDMAKLNYQISGYDEKLLRAIPEASERNQERENIVRGTKEVQDLALQSGKYWTGKVKDIQTLYAAQSLIDVKSANDVKELILKGKLPNEALISEDVYKNIVDGLYIFQPKGVDEKDDVTVKALMKLPLDSLEFGENTQGVLSSSYFSNRATTDDTVGMTRFELLQNGNPHLVSKYSNVYNRVNELFTNEIKDFADKILEEVNKNSTEKLLEQNGEYTEYGEYVVDLLGFEIARYAFMKAVAGNNLKAKYLSDGKITYDYNNLKDLTSLKALGINAYSPEDEATKLFNVIHQGIDDLSGEDVKFVADSISNQIKGTNVNSFRLAEAIVDRAGIGLDWRLDAAKDLIDMDSIRNEDNSFDDNWDHVIKFWSKFVQTIKSENPNAYIVAEITDIDDLMMKTYGQDACPYKGMTNIGQKFNGEPDAMAKFYMETGITSEAAYPYFFTDLLNIFAPSFEDGGGVDFNHNKFKSRLDLLMQTRSIDYLRNLYTFMGNHDKPRTIHGLAVDMGLFHANFLNDYKDFAQNRNRRYEALAVLTGNKPHSEIPIEIRLNMDNNDYFANLSNKAIAQSKLLMDIVQNDINEIIRPNDKALITDALIDLTNGNYLGTGKTEELTRIDIPELSSLKNAFTEIIRLAEENGFRFKNPADKEFLVNAIVDKANSKDLSGYQVHGDFNWGDLSPEDKRNNDAQARNLLGSGVIFDKYSLYTVKLAKLLKDSFYETGHYKEARSQFDAAFRTFVETYTKDVVSAHTKLLPKTDDSQNAMRKNGYGARDLKTAITMAIKQAEYKSHKTIYNKKEIIDNVYKLATEPAVAKMAMYMEYLKGLIGINTNYSGDELGMSGYEEKAKNIYLQNRNVLPWSELENNDVLGRYRKDVMEGINSTVKDRSNPDLHSLNDGTPYPVYVEGGNASNVATLMQSANGDMTVSVFNANDVDFYNRCDYFAKYGLDTEEKRKKFFEDNCIESINEHNKYVPIAPRTAMNAIILGTGVAIPVGTIFVNSNLRDQARYVVKDLGGRLGIVNSNGLDIVMNGATSKNGVMILRKLAKNIPFKGKNPRLFNKQYNIGNNIYHKTEQPLEGSKLSLISR